MDRRRARASERAAADEVVRRRRAEQRARVRTVQAIAICFTGVLAALVGIPHLVFLAAAGAGLLAVAILPGDAAREAVGAPPRPMDLAWGIAGAGAALAITAVYILLLRAGGARVGDVSWRRPTSVAILTVAIVPALTEEWLCRGALWAACRRLTAERATIAATAVLFGLLHALEWGPFGVPSRVGVGLVLGLLRARTGGLTAPVTAHLLNNLVAAGLTPSES